MKQLAFDSSNQELSVAVLDGTEILSELIINQKRNHSLQLMPAINQLLEQTEISKNDLNRIIVGQGPGSFTGVRIAVTTAKSLAWALGIELVGLSSLQVLAGQVPYASNRLVVALMDARRENVYSGIYQYRENGEFHIIRAEKHQGIMDLVHEVKQLGKMVYFAGPDVKDFKEPILQHLGGLVTIPTPNQSLARAGVMGQLTQSYISVDPHQFTPNYLKQSLAEENWYSQHPDVSEGHFIEKVD